MIISILLALVLFGCVGFLYREGVWGNSVRLINLVTAGLLAMNFFEPAASWLTGMMPSFTIFWDFLAIWFIFALSLSLMHEITDRICPVKVRFLKVVDQVGGPILAIVIGWVMVGFTLTALHVAPLGKTFLFGSFESRGDMFLGMMAPDRQWLAFTRYVSAGTYSRSDAVLFDPQAKFPDKQAERRAKVETYIRLSGAVRIDPNTATSTPPVPKQPQPAKNEPKNPAAEKATPATPPPGNGKAGKAPAVGQPK